MISRKDTPHGKASSKTSGALEIKGPKSSRMRKVGSSSTWFRDDNVANRNVSEEANVRIAKLFPNGRSQAVRIPAELAFDTDRVMITRHGNGLLIEPAPVRGLLALLASWEPLDEDFPEIEDAPPGPEELF